MELFSTYLVNGQGECVMSVTAIGSNSLSLNKPKVTIADWFQSQGVETSNKEDVSKWRWSAAKENGHGLIIVWLSSTEFAGTIYTQAVQILFGITIFAFTLFCICITDAITGYLFGNSIIVNNGSLAFALMALIICNSCILFTLAYTLDKMLVWKKTKFYDNVFDLLSSLEKYDYQGEVPYKIRQQIRGNLSRDENLQARIHWSEIDPFVEYRHPDYPGQVYIEHWD